jgi:hypothetical protein
VGCDLDEIIGSHAVVFAAEEARMSKNVVDSRLGGQRSLQSVTSRCIHKSHQRVNQSCMKEEKASRTED